MFAVLASSDNLNIEVTKMNTVSVKNGSSLTVIVWHCLVGQCCAGWCLDRCLAGHSWWSIDGFFSTPQINGFIQKQLFYFLAFDAIGVEGSFLRRSERRSWRALVSNTGDYYEYSNGTTSIATSSS
jgi:hypothetical protein